MQGFDVTGWVSRGQYKTPLGQRELFVAPGAVLRGCPVFQYAYSLKSWRLKELRDAGFEIRRPDVLFWHDPTADQDAIRELVRVAAAEAREALVRILAAREAERVANAEFKRQRDEREAAMRRERCEYAQGLLRKLLSAKPWLMQGKVATEAQLLVDKPEITLEERLRVEVLYSAAVATDKRARDRLAAEADGLNLERCQDSNVRAAVTEACRYLSGLDLDRAKESNSEGWSRSTTVLGHTMAGMECLSPLEAAHGLKILVTHRRQLPAEMRDRLFKNATETDMTERKSYTSTRKPWSPVAPRPVETPAEMEARYAREEADWQYITQNVKPPERVTQR